MNSSAGHNSRMCDIPDDGLFRRERVCCPVCENEFGCDCIDPACYISDSTHLDMKPKYQWKKRIWSRCLPEMFYLIRCNECSFCGDFSVYNDSVGDLNMLLPLFRKRMKETLNGTDAVLPLLLDSADPSGQGGELFIAALRHHLLAIYQLRQFGNLRERDSLRLGKYTLHLSWLLQDIDRSGAKPAIVAALDALKEQLTPLWPNVPLTVELARRQALEYYSNCFYLSTIPEARNIEHHILMIMVRLNLVLNQNREAEELIFKCLRKLNAQLAAPRRLLKNGDAETQLMAQTRIMTINANMAAAQQLLQTVKEHHHNMGQKR